MALVVRWLLVLFLAVYTNNPALPKAVFTDRGSSWEFVVGGPWSSNVFPPVYWVSCKGVLDLVPVYAAMNSSGTMAVQDTTLKGWYSSTFYPTTSKAVLVSRSIEDSLAVVDFWITVGAPCNSSRDKRFWLRLETVDGLTQIHSTSWGSIKQRYR